MGKTIIEFYPFDVDYDEKDEAIVIFGYTKGGERVIVVDKSFRPYFFVIVDKDKKEEVINILKELELSNGEEKIKPIKVEEYELNLIGRKVNSLKVWVEKFSDIRHIKDVIKTLPGVSEVVETDIGIKKRYLMDKKFKMFTRVRCEGERIDSKKYKADYILEAEDIEETSSEFMENVKIMAVDIETYNPIGNPRPSKDPILMISIATNYGTNKVITWKRCNSEYAEIVESEMDVLIKFMETIEKEKPHIIVGYNSDNFDFPYINERAKKYKIDLTLGVDNSKLKINRRGIGHSAKIIGIPHIDLYLFIKNILGPTLKTETYDLNSVADELIGETKVDGFHWTEISKMWDSGGEDLKKMIEYSMKDAEITLKLMEKLFALIVELTKIVGQTPFDVSRMTYGQCVEWFLAKNAHEFKELIPPKPVGSFVTD